MIELDTFKKLMVENNDRLPLLTLDEFFEGNTAEDSIAPNDCDFGRPSIAEIWELMRNLEKDPILHGFALNCTMTQKLQSMMGTRY